MNCWLQASGTEPPVGGEDGGDESPTSTKSQLLVGLAMGFGVIIALVIVLCVVWKCCCKMMNGQATGKVAPADDDDPENPGLAAGTEDDADGL